MIGCRHEKQQQQDINDQPVETVDKIVVAYASAGGGVLPNPHDITHVNMAFGNVNRSYDGVDVRDTLFLRQLIDLKQQNKDLKVLLSIGGWTSGGFSEMASTAETRSAFVASCCQIVDKFQLDGIDLDWEYPSSDEAGITASPNDIDNFTSLIKELRMKLGATKLITIATIADALYVDFAAIKDDVDYVNVMMYDVARPPFHHSAVFRCSLAGRITVEEALKAHEQAGLPKDKIVLGVPFYGHGIDKISDFIDYADIEHLDGYRYVWNDTAHVPCLLNNDDKIVLCFDDSASIAYKCQYVVDNAYKGIMYWETKCDNNKFLLSKVISSMLLSAE
ncbi:MAG: glycosyl hydrolase family 18 protein [Bacteroidales bacterium]|nr:glycosyl hydrolase family 18 protein [Bacteroidales bacterium]